MKLVLAAYVQCILSIKGLSKKKKKKKKEGKKKKKLGLHFTHVVPLIRIFLDTIGQIHMQVLYSSLL